MLTLERLRSHVVAALGRQPAGANSIEYLVNEAGQAWSNLKAWPYQSGQRMVLALVPGQVVYGLGVAFLELQKLVDSTGYANEARLVARAAFEELRELYPQAQHPMWSGTIYDGAVAGVPQKVLEIHPAPVAASELIVVYRRGWTPVSTLEEPIELPAQLEPAFLSFVELYARGRERKLPLEEAMRLAATSDLVQAAMFVDGNQLPAQYPRLGRIGRQHAFRTANMGGMYIQTPFGPRLRTPGSSI